MATSPLLLSLIRNGRSCEQWQQRHAGRAGAERAVTRETAEPARSETSRISIRVAATAWAYASSKVGNFCAQRINADIC